MGVLTQTVSGSAPATTRKTHPLTPNQRQVLERAIALIICASVCVMAFGMVQRHSPAAPSGHAAGITAPVA